MTRMKHFDAIIIGTGQAARPWRRGSQVWCISTCERTWVPIRSDNLLLRRQLRAKLSNRQFRGGKPRARQNIL